MTDGRIDVHAHLLPGIDDGCANLDQSLACAKMLVDAGYSHAFCTPHIWPNLAHYNNPADIAQRTQALQQELLRREIPLRLMPGGELNLRPEILSTPKDHIVTYALKGQFCIFDLWADVLPPHFEPGVKYLQSFGLTVILAHPERMRAAQDNPDVADYFKDLGLLLQGNLQCFSDPPTARTRQLVERWLLEDRYFLLGSDTHNPQTLPLRLAGLTRAIEIGGEALVDRLTNGNPQKLMSGPPS